MTTIAQLSVLVDADINRFQSGMATVNNSIDATARGMQNLGASMSNIGQSTAAISLPIVAGLGYAVVAATEFDTAMTNVNSILQNGAEDAAALNAEILNIGSNAVAGPQAVAEAYYDVVGGVADAANHIPILNAAIATSEAGSADLTATTNVLIGAMNAYGASAEDAAFYSDVLTATVGMGVGSMDSFASAMPAVTGVASSMGIEFDQLGGMMAFLTTRGTSAAEASTQLGGAMISLIRPSENMSTALQAIGFESGQAAVEALGLQGTYQALADAGFTNFAELTNGVEAMRGAIALTSEGATGFLANFANNIDGATAAARAVQLEGASAQFSLLQSAVSGLAITLGQSLMLALSDMATSLTPIVQGITNWAAANPELSGTLVAIVGGAAGLLAAAIPLGMAISGLGAIFGLAAPVLAFFASPLIIVATAIAGLIAISGDLPALGTAIENVVTAFTGLTSGTSTDYAALGTALVDLADISLTAIADGAINLLGALVGQDFATIGEQWGSIGGMLEAAWNGIQVVLTMAQLGIQNAGLSVQLEVQNFISQLRDTILSATGGAIDIAPTIEMDIAATQAQIQTNIDNAIASVDAINGVPVTVTASEVDTTGLLASVELAVNDPNITVTGTFGAFVTVTEGTTDVTAVTTAAEREVNGIRVDGAVNANVTVTASVDASSAQASVQSAVDSLSIHVGGSFGGTPVAEVEGGGEVVVPSGATGADIQGEGLMYVHANEKLLNAADTELYNNGGGSGGGGGSTQQNYYLTTYGTSPMEVLTMVKRASRSSAPG